MSIEESQLDRLRAFGYTDVEARFLRLVATHAGYFTVRQFLDFARAKSGKRSARLVAKLFGLGHASAQRYRRNSLVYHLHSRPIYDAIGKGGLRNRSRHELGYIKARLLALDYILAYPQDDYFETARAKREYFIERFRVPESLFLQPNERGGGITFADRFPLSLTCPSLQLIPAVIFTYIDFEHKNLQAFIAHLRRYQPLFRQLPGFQFVYISTASGQQKQAGELFALFTEGKGLQDLTRYFDLQTKWDSGQFGLLTEPDVLFLNEGRKRFTGDSIGTLYRLWKRNQMPKDLQADSPSRSLHTAEIIFRAITVPGHEAIFGDSTRRWSDGWHVQGMSGLRSPRNSLATPRQTLQTAADR